MFCSSLEAEEEKLFSIWTDGEFSKESYDCSKSGSLVDFKIPNSATIMHTSSIRYCLDISQFFTNIHQNHEK